MIYGVGLPRTGTTTLAHALRVLGYRGKSSCMVTNKSFSISPIKEFVSEFNVDNSYYSHVPKVEAGDRIILTIRDQEDWIKSIIKYPRNVIKDMPSMAIYIEYIKELYPSNPILIINWSDCENYQCNWEKLCDFLGELIPTADFPCKNCPDGH